MKLILCVKIILAIVFISVIEKSNAQAPDWLWAQAMTGNAELNSIAVNPIENEDIYITGTFSGTVDFNPGNDTFNITSAGDQNMYISKLDKSGHFLWAKSMGGTSWFNRLLTAVDPFSGDIYNTGNFLGTVDFDPGPDTFNLTSAFYCCANTSGDMFISKLDTAGNLVWAKSIDYKDNSLYVTSIAVDPSGNGDVYTTGHFSGVLDFDPGPDTFNLISAGSNSMFISKLDSSGNFVWAKAIGGEGYVDSYSLAIDPLNGAVYTTGCFLGTIDFDPGSDTFNIKSTGSIGCTQPHGVFCGNMFISKLDNSGDFLWAISGAGKNVGRCIAVDPAGSGDIYIAGDFGGAFFDLESAGAYDIFITKIDSNGQFKWSKAIGGAGRDRIMSLVVDASENEGVYAAGQFYGIVDFDPNTGNFDLSSNTGEEEMFISKLDGSGNFEWAMAVEGNNGFGPYPLTLDRSGHLYVSGSFRTSTISFGSTILFNADESGQTPVIFIAKLDTAFTTSVVKVDSIKYPINLYPNPVNNKLTIEVDGGEFFNVNITVFNVLGEVVYFNYDENFGQKKTIDISALSAGIYFVELNIDGNRMIEKVVKE